MDIIENIKAAADEVAAAIDCACPRDGRRVLLRTVLVARMYVDGGVAQRELDLALRATARAAKRVNAAYEAAFARVAPLVELRRLLAHGHAARAALYLIKAVAEARDVDGDEELAVEWADLSRHAASVALRQAEVSC